MESKTGRYSLVLNENYIVDVLNKLDFYNIKEEIIKETKQYYKHKKFSLSIIDAFTTQFETEEQLKHYLSKKLDLKVNSIQIIYKENKQVKKAPIVFSDQQEIKELSNDNFGSYQIKEKSQTKMINRLFNLKKSSKIIYDFLTDQRYIGKKLKEDIEKCYNFEGSKKDYQFLEDKLRNRLSYKSYRDICEGIKELHDLTKPYYKEENYITDPEEEIEKYNNGEINSDWYYQKKSEDIFDNPAFNEEGQYILPLDKVGYVKTLTK